jgi:hypothetical protein
LRLHDRRALKIDRVLGLARNWEDDGAGAVAERLGATYLRVDVFEPKTAIVVDVERLSYEAWTEPRLVTDTIVSNKAVELIVRSGS